MEQNNYCEHFKNLKINKYLQIDSDAVCKLCVSGRENLWICLAKDCDLYFCDLHGNEHMKVHLEQSRNKKSFHSCFINIHTAQIRCIYCGIQIYDLQQNEKNEQFQNPYPSRLKILPGLADLSKYKILGQLENSQGHRKYNKGLTGLFAAKQNNIINSVVQFFYHCSFLNSILITAKFPENQKILFQLSKIITNLQGGVFRAIRSDQIGQAIFAKVPQLLGYKRKDPIMLIQMILNLAHEYLKKYKIVDELYREIDQWDLLSKNKSVQPESPIFNNTKSIISLNLECEKCKVRQSFLHKLDYLKISIPKKRKKVKEIEKDLQEHRYSSPVKKARKSLMNFILPPEPECPITIPELLIYFLNLPLTKQKACPKCSQAMKKVKNYFIELPQTLIIAINRFGKDGNTTDNTYVQPQTTSLDLGPFTNNKNNSVIYDFQSAICLQKNCLFPVITRNLLNKQLYVFRNQMVEMIKEPLNCYIACYRKRITQSQQYAYHNILSSIKCQINPDYILPDFWLNHIQHGIEIPLHNQRVCKHNKIKPFITTKMKIEHKIPKEIYEALVQKYGGKLYHNQICNQCILQVQQINKRKNIEKQAVCIYDKIKTPINCMVSQKWLKKWSNFIFKKGEYSYLSRGYPMPGTIDNRVLLDKHNKCLQNLRKNQDYKVINIFVWKLLKQIYGGGPQIRYKWKESKEKIDEQLLKEIQLKAKQIKDTYNNQKAYQLPTKSILMQNSTSFVSSVKDRDQDQLSP